MKQRHVLSVRIFTPDCLQYIEMRASALRRAHLVSCYSRCEPNPTRATPRGIDGQRCLKKEHGLGIGLIEQNIRLSFNAQENL